MDRLGADAATNGSLYLRVGSSNRRADSGLIEELRRFARGEGFHEQPMLGLDSEALDLRAASESFVRYRRLGCRDHETPHRPTEHQGRKVRSTPVRGVEETIALPQNPKRRYFRAKRGSV